MEKLFDFNESSSVIVGVYGALYNIDIINDHMGGDGVGGCIRGVGNGGGTGPICRVCWVILL